MVRGNGTATSYGYDAASRLTSLSHDVAGTAYDVTFGYGYNPAGQIVSRTVSNDAYAWAGSSNRNDASDVNGLNQATHVGGATLGYDGRGNLTRDGGAATLRYNTRDELLVNGLGDYINHDPVGQLAQLYIGGHYTNLHNAAGTLAVEYDGSTNAVARRYVDGPGTDEPIVWYEGAGTGDRRFLLADERGSVVAVSDGSGAVTAVNTYDEYGVPGSGNVGRFQYTGQKWLAGLGLYDYKARMYAPGLGRFLQPDPIGYGDGMNWYGYVGGDPVNATDPEGLFPTDIVVIMPRKSKKPPPPPVAAAAGLVFSHNGISGFGSQAGPLDDVLEDDIIVTAVRAPKAGSRVGRLPQDKQPVCPALSASTAPASRRHSSPNWTRPGWQVLYKTLAGYRSLSRSGYGHNDSSDAWRHFRWSFSMAQTMGDTAARDFLEYHERAEPNPPGEAHMDANNNAMGLAFANDPRYADLDPDVAANLALKRGCLQTGIK